MKTAIILAAALFFGTSMIVSRLQAAEQTRTNVFVEVLIFSGRPNPTWPIEDTKALEKLKSNLKNLPASFTNEPPAWSTLGFKGFFIHNADRLGLPAQVRIYEGVINTGHGQTA